MQRRTWLGLGLGSAVLLAAGGSAVALWRPAWQQGKLTPAGREVMAAVARAVLDGMLPTEPGALAAALTRQLQGLEQTIAAFPGAVQLEISDLLSLLAAAPGRRLLAGLATPWPEASIAEIAAALNDMRTSGMALRVQAYHALRDLNHGSFYADASHWAAIGYPGPPRVSG